MQNITASGVGGFDKILYGGLPKGSSIIVEGAPGTGKTTLGVQFLYHGAVNCGEPGIYITFEEFPQQIYQDMKVFGWDLRELEKQNLIRVISIQPDMLLQQMAAPEGLFEQMVREINCQRIVVDSISLFQYIHKDPEEARKILYQIRNVFRKFSMTALLISEQTQWAGTYIPFEHYVADGVIRLSLEPQMNKYRKRTLEVLKMRGRKIVEGEHIYRITERGIYLVPALSMVEDVLINSENQCSTGIPRLDRLLEGGIPQGSSFILDTNSKANYKYLVASIVTKRIKNGDRIIAFPSSISSVSDVQQLYRLYDVELEEVCKRDGIYFIEHYNRPAPPGFEHVVFHLKDLSNEEYISFLSDKVSTIMVDSLKRGERWFAYYDLNALFSHRGADFVKRFYAEQTAWARTHGVTVIALCNFSEIHGETASYLERTANGVIRTWVDGNYQYLQITKSPTGTVSEPHLVETITDMPFIQLV
jgi:circadian clock protein KaiC